MTRARICRVLWSRFRYDVETKLLPHVLIVRGNSVRSNSSNRAKEVCLAALPAEPWLWYGWVDRRFHHCFTMP